MADDAPAPRRRAPPTRSSSRPRTTEPRLAPVEPPTEIHAIRTEAPAEAARRGGRGRRLLERAAPLRRARPGARGAARAEEPSRRRAAEPSRSRGARAARRPTPRSPPRPSPSSRPTTTPTPATRTCSRRPPTSSRRPPRTTSSGSSRSLRRTSTSTTEKLRSWRTPVCHSLTKGKVRATKLHTSAMIDWIAAYDATSERCYYIPSRELGATGHAILHLRLQPARNNQRIGIREAAAYTDPDFNSDPSVEPAGFEPATSSLQRQALCQLSYGPASGL